MPLYLHFPVVRSLGPLSKGNAMAAVLMPEIDFGNDDLPNLDQVLDELRPRGPAVPIKYWGEPAWAILDHAEVDRAFNDNDTFNSTEIYKRIVEPAMGRTLNMLQGDEHRHQRSLVNAPFMPRAMRNNVEVLLEPVAREILERMTGKSEFEFVEGFARLFPFTVITRLLNIPVHDERIMLECAIKLLEFPWDPDGALAARATFDNYISGLIAARRQHPTGDFISMLVDAEDDGQKLSDDAIATFCRLLFPAGSDTTYKGLGSLFSFVLSDESLRARARGSDADRYAIVSESLRLQPPVAMQIRSAAADAQIGSAHIKRGDTVLLSIMAANRDPKVFANPHKFDPARDNRHLISFGRNVHFCLGMHLARREMETALKVVLERFPNMSLVPDRPIKIVSAVLRGPRELWIHPAGRA